MERYIWLYGKHITVTQEVYEAYYRPQWREQKQCSARLWRETSLENMPDDLEHLMMPSAEDVFVAEQAARELHQALKVLANDEYNLIMQIYFQECSEREIAKELGISQMMVNKRKHQILKKLKNIIK